MDEVISGSVFSMAIEINTEFSLNVGMTQDLVLRSSLLFISGEELYLYALTTHIFPSLTLTSLLDCRLIYPIVECLILIRTPDFHPQIYFSCNLFCHFSQQQLLFSSTSSKTLWAFLISLCLTEIITKSCCLQLQSISNSTTFF